MFYEALDASLGPSAAHIIRQESYVSCARDVTGVLPSNGDVGIYGQMIGSVGSQWASERLHSRACRALQGLSQSYNCGH